MHSTYAFNCFALSLLAYLLLLTVTLQMPSCGVVCYMFQNNVPVFLLLSAALILTQVQNFENVLWHYISITACINLYRIILLQLVFSFATITEHMLLKLKEFIVTLSTGLYTRMFCSIS